MEYLSYINGKPIEPKGAFLEKYNPFTGELMGRVHNCEAMDLIPAIIASKKAMTALRDTTLDVRRQWIEKMLTYVVSNLDEIAFREALEQGLPFSFMRDEVLSETIKEIKSLVADMQLAHPLQMPSGVVAIILPWTLSFKFGLEKLTRALAAGNAVLLKISPLSPITGDFLFKAIEFAGIPESYVQIFQGDKTVAQFIGSHPAVTAVTANGSQSSLEDLSKEGLRTYKKMQLSGGVKNSAFVLSDFDLAANFDQVMRSFMLGQGQLCFNTTKLFILEKQVDLFKSLAQDYFTKLTPSQGPKDNSLWTPMVNAQAVDRSLQRIKAGAGERGKLFLGGEKISSQGFFLNPAVMLDLTNCSELQQDDLQAPLLLVGAVKYQHEMAKWANNTYLAHSAVIWGSREKAQKVAQQIDAELIQLNEWKIPSEPVFGFKNSSYGNGDSLWRGSFYSQVKKLTGN